MERLLIKNFAGFSHAVFEFNEFNIIVGPQASGKSVVAKLCYFFKETFSKMAENLIARKSYNEFLQSRLNDFLRYFPAENYTGKKFEILFAYNYGTYIKVKYGRKLSLELPFHYEFDYENYSKEISLFLEVFAEGRNNGKINRRGLTDTLKEVLGREYSNSEMQEQFFVPATRSFLSLINENVFNLTRGGIIIDPFLAAFGALYSVIKRRTANITQSKSKTEIFDTLTTDIVKAVYNRIDERDFLRHIDDRNVSVADSSSGQQASLPLVTFLASLPELVNSEGCTVYIEEPEAHLFPLAQKLMTQLISYSKSISRNRVQIFITTHSPYVLAACNNLVLASELDGQRKKTVRVRKVIPKHFQIDFTDLAVYMIKDNKAINLLNKKTKLIDVNMLDDVSEDIATEFEQLLGIE